MCRAFPLSGLNEPLFAATAVTQAHLCFSARPLSGGRPAAGWGTDPDAPRTVGAKGAAFARRVPELHIDLTGDHAELTQGRKLARSQPRVKVLGGRPVRVKQIADRRDHRELVERTDELERLVLKHSIEC